MKVICVNEYQINFVAESKKILGKIKELEEFWNLETKKKNLRHLYTSVKVQSNISEP